MYISIQIAITLCFVTGYALLILIYYRAWNALEAVETGEPEWSGSENLISVVVPARDEAGKIGDCLRSILSQQGAPPFEIIVVDDHSRDETVQEASSTGDSRVKVVRLGEVALSQNEVAYKKRAIEEGVGRAGGDIIVTTDADCRHHPEWLASIGGVFQSGSVDMVSGPVLFDYDGSLFQRFQALDFIGMIGITAASLKLKMFNLANGANLAFRKSVFRQVGGYAGIDRKASGDDMLLIYKFAHAAPDRVRFLKSRRAAVYTPAARTLGEFVQQRLRWTSKSFNYQDKRITLILAFVYLANVLCVVNAVLAICCGHPAYYLLLAFQLAAMFTVDYVFLKRVTDFFDRRDLMRTFLPSQLMHIAYILVIGLMGNLVQYRWKGRKLK